jgi:transcriptional regulator with XRE-family HTH domain
VTIAEPTNTPIELGYKLRFLILAELEAQGLTQAVLAERTGFSTKHVSQMLNARCGMTVKNADTLLRALNREWTVGTAPAFGEPVLENWRLDKAAVDTGSNATEAS